MSTFDRRRPQSEVQPFVEMAQALLENQGALFAPKPVRLVVAGSIRRQARDVGDLDLIVVTDEPLTAFGWPIHATEKKASHWLEVAGESMFLDAWRCPPDALGPFALFLTGPATLNVQMRQVAEYQGLFVSQYGVFEQAEDERGRRCAGVRIDTPNPAADVETQEKAVLEALGLTWLAPTERDRHREAW